MVPNRFQFFFALLFFVAVFPLAATPVPPDWTALDNCRLEQTNYADGDSFHVIHRGRNLHFRLYFVDCPETDVRFPERIQEQMKAFGLDEKALVAAGHSAHDFSSRMLSQPFTILTKWQYARGASAQERFYAVVLIDKKNLAEELVRSGFARAYGMHPDFPSQVGARQFQDKLKRLQNEAARLRVGAFAESAAVSPVPEKRSRPYEDQQGVVSDCILEEGLRAIEVDFN
jgi:endonuclease YncB( thermonuclease family)